MQHRPLHLVTLALLLSWSSAQAQEGKTKTNQQLVWFVYNNTLTFSPKWALATDIQERRFINPSAQHQFLVRTKVQYTLGQGWDVGLGGCIFWQSPNDPNSTSDLVVPELRPHLEVSQKQKVRFFKINHRYKAEARFFHHVQNGELRDGYSFRNFRFRYRLGIDVPLLKSADKKLDRLTLRVNDEIHLNAGEQVVMNTFDQNRIYAGISYSATPDLSIEVGYLNWFQEQPSGDDYFNRNIFRLAINHKISLEKKKPGAEAPKG
ncbi:MAG: DUF2490 domain-containing protein [Flavobacteriales bacterium]